MSRYLDPRAGVVFKKIFGGHLDLLISFLNAVLPLPEDRPIVEINCLPTYQVTTISEFRCSIVGVKCTDALKRMFIVEVQMNWTDSFEESLLFDFSCVSVRSASGSGEHYDWLYRTYRLNLVAKAYDVTEDWNHHYQVTESNLHGDEVNRFNLIFIELPKVPVSSPKEKPLRLLWLRFLREINEKTETISEDLLAIPEIAKAVKLAERSAYTPAELESYQSPNRAFSSQSES